MSLFLIQEAIHELVLCSTVIIDASQPPLITTLRLGGCEPPDRSRCRFVIGRRKLAAIVPAFAPTTSAPDLTVSHHHCTLGGDPGQLGSNKD